MPIKFFTVEPFPLPVLSSLAFEGTTGSLLSTESTGHLVIAHIMKIYTLLFLAYAKATAIDRRRSLMILPGRNSFS